MKMYCMTPCNRPEDIPNLLGNFSRQEYPNKVLVLVLNGIARNCTFVLPDDVVVLFSEENTGKARNVAMEYIAERGGPWCHLDSDDWYGPRYLTDISKYIELYPLYLISRDELDIMTDTRGLMPRTKLHFHGACFASTDTTKRYPEIVVGEDFGLFQLFGKKVINMPYSDQYVYRRVNNGKGNTWKATDSEVKFMNWSITDHDQAQPKT